MKLIFLNFEQLIAELTSKIDELRFVQDEFAVDISDETTRLKKKNNKLTKSIFSKLTPAQISQMFRHSQRSYILDYINGISTDFEELYGDHHHSDDHAIVGGLARFNGQSVTIIGHRKGRDTKEEIYRNFDMPRSEGYRKALRLMQTAEKFGIPVMVLVDTPGVYPDTGAEERSQSETIGHNLYELTYLHVPVLCTIIGEGGPGGALAAAAGDYINMLQYSTHSVISPEGCASILWETVEKVTDAAQVSGITVERLQELDLIDKVINEPLGGAHRNYETTVRSVKTVLEQQLSGAQSMTMPDLLSCRFDRIMAYSKFTDK